MRRFRRDRPEFVHLASVSSGSTSQNGQTQTEDRKTNVRGCTEGKGGGTMKKRKEGVVVAKRWLRTWRVRGEGGGTQHDNNTTQQ